MRVLITGSKGQVGCCLKNQLNHLENVTLLAVDKEQLDITHKNAVHTTVCNFKPDVIINAAAHTSVDKAETEVALSYAINCDGAKYLAESAQHIDAVIIHISTDYVFDGSQVHNYHENDVTNPESVYGKSKLAGENAVAKACRKHIILRTSWVFGKQGHNFVNTMLQIGKKRSALSVVGDQFGSPTYAEDIAKALITIANQALLDKKTKFGVYHYSGQPYVSWFDFANVIFDQAITQKILTKKPLLQSITTEQYPTAAKRPKNSCLDITKINNAFSIKASDWKAALHDLKDYAG